MTDLVDAIDVGFSFDGKIEVACSSGSNLTSVHTVHVAGNTESSICLFFIHGAGSSAHTWHNQVEYMRSFAFMLALDLRSHGKSSTEIDMDLQSLVNDSVFIISSDIIYDMISKKKLIIVGHSLGGVIATMVAHRKGLKFSVSSVIALDTVEETAISNLSHMEEVLASWPQSFPNKEDYLNWATRIGRPFSRASAALSLPSLFIEEGNSNNFIWRTNLLESKEYWSGWFRGFDNSFLTLTIPHLLILSTMDILDTTLTVAHMQGKIEIEAIRALDTSHFFHEDFPDETVAIIIKFINRKGFISDNEAADMLKASFSSHYRRYESRYK